MQRKSTSPAKRSVNLATGFSDESLVWLAGAGHIQRELDTTWAVFGEIYGRFDTMNGFGLTIRRIRSTLDDLPALSKRLTYLPVHARFRSSDTELLRLLVGPLYGNDLTIGVRELIQNAVDACRERADLQPNWIVEPADERTPDVDVFVEERGTKK